MSQNNGIKMIASSSASAGLLCKERDRRDGRVNMNNGIRMIASSSASASLLQRARQETWECEFKYWHPRLPQRACCKAQGRRNGSVNKNNGVLDCVSGLAVQKVRQGEMGV